MLVLPVVLPVVLPLMLLLLLRDLEQAGSLSGLCAPGSLPVLGVLDMLDVRRRLQRLARASSSEAGLACDSDTEPPCALSVAAKLADSCETRREGDGVDPLGLASVASVASVLSWLWRLRLFWAARINVRSVEEPDKPLSVVA